MVEDIEAYGASIHTRKVRLILCLAQIVFQIQITLKNVFEIQNTKYILKVSKIQNTNYIQCILNMYFNYLYFNYFTTLVTTNSSIMKLNS